MNIIPVDKNSDNHSLNCMNSCHKLAKDLIKRYDKAQTVQEQIEITKAVTSLYNTATSAGQLAVNALTASVKANESVIKHRGVV